MDPDRPLSDRSEPDAAEAVAVPESDGREAAATPQSDAGEPLVAPPPESIGAPRPVSGPARMWGYRDLLYFVMFAVPAFLLVAIISMAAIMGLNQLPGWELAIENPQVQAPLVIVIQLFWWAIVLGYIYVVVTAKYELPFGPSIGWVRVERPAFFYLSSGVLLAFAVVAASTVIPQPEGRLPIEALLEDRFSMLLMAVFGVLIAPALEEIVFRGFIYRVFENAHGTVAAILITSAAFSFVHGMQYGWRWQNLLLLAAVGIVFGVVRARTGSVVSTTLIHASYNATLFAALFVAGDQIKKT